ncbi:MAG: hydroxymethylbilane synthase [Saprospiraceae bacterium]|nr:hydroxymethylbilane synthase [Saprospiraceae bacterium]
MANIRIGTRGSKLALWQANFIKDQLESLGHQVQLTIIKTKGDKIQHLGFDKIEGKGFFTKELEDALLEERVDLAVHSMKDLPTTQPEGLRLAAVSYRANPSDCLILRKEVVDESQDLSFKANAIIGTSSARRKAQMLHFRPDINLKDIRGNVPTRLQKLREQQFDGILLATAGLERLKIDLSEFHCIEFDPREFIPAPAQGVLALQVRATDRPLYDILRRLHNSATVRCTNIERGVLQLTQGGCHIPLGVYCEQDSKGNYHVWAAQAATWESPLRSVQLSSSSKANLAQRVFDKLQQVNV